MLFVGLSGSIATGKSTVAKEFEKLGCHIIDADKLAHKVYEKDSKAYFKIIDIFGSDILNKSGMINRTKLRNRVVNNKNKLRQLESIIHPEVEQLRNQIIKNITKKDKNAIIIYDVPLLFEKNMQHLFDYTIVVYTDKKTQLNRLMQRNGLSKQEAEKLISLQMDIDKKVKMADFVINNSLSIQNTYQQIIEVFNNLKEKL